MTTQNSKSLTSKLDPNHSGPGRFDYAVATACILLQKRLATPLPEFELYMTQKAISDLIALLAVGLADGTPTDKDVQLVLEHLKDAESAYDERLTEELFGSN